MINLGVKMTLPSLISSRVNRLIPSGDIHPYTFCIQEFFLRGTKTVSTGFLTFPCRGLINAKDVWVGHLVLQRIFFMLKLSSTLFFRNAYLYTPKGRQDFNILISKIQYHNNSSIAITNSTKSIFNRCFGPEWLRFWVVLIYFQIWVIIFLSIMAK